MERLLVVKLEALGCAAEVWLNGIGLAQLPATAVTAATATTSATPAAGSPVATVWVPAHEYTLAGDNRLELSVTPVPGAAGASARVRVLLPRTGHAIDEGQVRTLAQLDWVEEPGAARLLRQDLALPVNFPRWRWLDAPLLEVTPDTQALVLGFVQAMAADLAAGKPERFIAATRLRTEELAVAYQRPPADEAQRWRQHLLQLHGAGDLRFPPLQPADLVLRPLAGGRLLECLNPQGRPLLASEPDTQGRTHAFPLRVAIVEGQVYVLR